MSITWTFNLNNLNCDLNAALTWNTCRMIPLAWTQHTSSTPCPVWVDLGVIEQCGPFSLALLTPGWNHCGRTEFVCVLSKPFNKQTLDLLAVSCDQHQPTQPWTPCGASFPCTLIFPVRSQGVTVRHTSSQVKSPVLSKQLETEWCWFNAGDVAVRKDTYTWAHWPDASMQTDRL